VSYKTLNEYGEKLYKTLLKVDNIYLEKLITEIKSRIEFEGEIFLLGNGGSAANAHHITGDYTKTFSMLGKSIKINCLSDNACYITAAANDIDFSEIYQMLVDTRIKQNDLIILLSGSGNSMNLIKAARKATSLKIKVAALIGYSGGALKKIADIPIHYYVDDMEIAEDCQIAIFHYIKQKIIESFSLKPNCNSEKYDKRTNQDLIA
tara:strand:- start:40 stop:660 length:621 start_codon:yes stop_codon:yes gene_type:complete